MTNTATQTQLSNFQDMPAINNSISLAGRILLSAIFLISGIGKIAAPVATIGYIASMTGGLLQIVAFGGGRFSLDGRKA